MILERIHKKIVLEIIFILVTPLLLYSPVIKNISQNNTIYKILFFGILLIRLIVILDLVKHISKRFYQKYILTKKTDKETNFNLIKTSLLICLLALESIFQFIPQNQDVYRLGLATKVWNAYFKKAENEKGFRDKPILSRTATKKQVVFFLGDSFTYGNGIISDKDRFTDMVAQSADTSIFEFFNLGKGNSDTKDEFLRLANFGLIPNIVILQYYHNDIEKVGAKYGHFNKTEIGYKNQKESKFKKVITAIGLFPIMSSFFLNYAGLNSSKFLISKSKNQYKQCLTNSFKDSNCLREHLEDLKSISNYCLVNNIKLYVLNIPDIRDIDYTQNLFNIYIQPFLKHRKIPIIYIDKQLKAFNTNELIVNPLNAHTNFFANRIIANQIRCFIPEFEAIK